MIRLIYLECLREIRLSTRESEMRGCLWIYRYWHLAWFFEFRSKVQILQLQCKGLSSLHLEVFTHLLDLALNVIDLDEWTYFPSHSHEAITRRIKVLQRNAKPYFEVEPKVSKSYCLSIWKDLIGLALVKRCDTPSMWDYELRKSLFWCAFRNEEHLNNRGLLFDTSPKYGILVVKILEPCLTSSSAGNGQSLWHFSS